MFEHMHNLYKNIHRLKKNLQNGLLFQLLFLILEIKL
jgi:hypothetical protein